MASKMKMLLFFDREDEHNLEDEVISKIIIIMILIV